MPQLAAAVCNSIEAIEQYLKFVVVPILVDDTCKDIDQIGTGSLIEIKNEIFILSAAHVFKNILASQLAVPADYKGSSIVKIWPFNIIESDDENDDLILLRLSTEIATKLREGWQTISLSQCGTARQDHAFILSGYPSSLVVKTGDKMGGTLVTTYTDLLTQVPGDAKSPISEEDLFLEYKENATKCDGTPIVSPRINGVSGAAIWGLNMRDEAGLWTPKSALTLVGVETDALHFKYIRGKSWKLIAEKMLSKI